MNLICGINPVLEALVSGSRHFERLLVVKGLRNRRISEAISRAVRASVPLRFETRETLDRIAGGVPHQGIVAVVSARPVMTLESLLDTARSPALLVVLDGVEDPRNLGAILRTAEAAGADGVLLPERHSAGLSETVNRASAGALEHVRVARVGNVVQALEALKARGIWVVGFDAAGAERWDQVDLTQPVALVVGGEGRGIRRLVREHCDHLASIPLFGHVASINVSVAAGIALFEAIRQRGAVPSHVRPIPARPASLPQIVGPGPGDPEQDPGASHGPVTEAVPEPEGDEYDVGEPIGGVVEFHEEVAWAGPTVLKPAGFARDPRRPRDRPRRHRPGGPPGRPGTGEGGSPDRPGDSGPEKGRRRRRRKGRRDMGPGPSRSDAGAPPTPPGAGPMGRPEGGPSAPGEASGGGAPGRPGPGGPGGGGRRRRRRRRRH
jgi:23S rRNA (guanosine2251-2'-O)-methyltransferase